jgi:Ferric uptake regulator family
VSCLPCGRSSVSTPICLRFFKARDGRGCLKVPPHPAGRVVHEARLFTRALHASVAATTGSTSVSATSVQISSAGTAQFKSAPLGPTVVQQPEIDSRLSGLGHDAKQNGASSPVNRSRAAGSGPAARAATPSRVSTDRTLDLLQVLGLVRATSLAGNHLCYEVFDGQEHHHFGCRTCHRVHLLS